MLSLLLSKKSLHLTVERSSTSAEAGAAASRPARTRAEPNTRMDASPRTMRERPSYPPLRARQSADPGIVEMARRRQRCRGKSPTMPANPGRARQRCRNDAGIREDAGMTARRPRRPGLVGARSRPGARALERKGGFDDVGRAA